ncbi:drebrin isoform X2 [Gouania willdenowi]|uniref:drebrin isoform X2 n=1 Tax=Gouania willdenowi TaxID=441366 RepID=UPI001054F64A|nr:drebrin isoform X2 [Gouania willdenowi]
MAVNLMKNRLVLLTAYHDVIDEASDTDWALYTYEDDTNDLTLASSGGGGLTEITLTFDSARVMYGFCSLKEPKAALPRYILINWVGDDVPDARKCACASHVATIADFFQGVEVIVNASSLEDVEPSAIGQRLTNGTVGAAAVVASPVLSRLKTREEELADVGTMYEKTNAESEMKKINREEFWEQAKREEELRKEEERKKALEERQRFEEERMELEKKEQENREKRYRERERQIEEHRKMMQEEEEEKEKLRGQITMVTEAPSYHEQISTCSVCLNMFPCFVQPAESSVDDLSLDKKESEVEEAKAIIAQRSGNPREFFKLKERAMTFSGGTSPVSVHRTGRLDSPFLRQQTTTGQGSPVHSQTHAGTAPTPPTAAEQSFSASSVPKIITSSMKEDKIRDLALEAEKEVLIQEATPPNTDQHRDSSGFSVWNSGTDRLVDLWDSSSAPNSAHSTELVDLMGDDITAAVRPQPLLSFDEMMDGTFCSGVGVAEDEQMTLSYRQALQHASGDHAQLLLTNGDALMKEGTQASEGYFSQSQEEDFDSSAKPAPVFYNKPPEIDITCWDTDPVVDDDDD